MLKLFKLGGVEYIEIKARNCVVTSNANKEFVLTRDSVTTAPMLAVEGNIYSVDTFVEFLKRGFRELLLHVAP